MNCIDKKDDLSLVKSQGVVLDISQMRKKTGLRKTSIAFKKQSRLSVPALQLLVMFDITRSMFPYFDLVREKLSKIISTIKGEISSVQFSVFAFRNHGDEKRYNQICYTSPLSADLELVYQAVASIQKGGGGVDGLSCMEDCLYEANVLAWHPLSSKAVVIIGDQPPHGVVDSILECPRNINYQDEINQLVSKKIKVYPIFCGHNKKIRAFYQLVAKQSSGRFLEIKDIDLLPDLLIGISMKQIGGMEKYYKKLVQNKQLGIRQKIALEMLK